MRAFFTLLGLPLLFAATHAAAQPVGQITFPQTATGEAILAADLHVHTVWSDGEVWPASRVREAKDEGLSVIALTEHVEASPHYQHLPRTNGLIDKNASFDLASKAAGSDLLVVRGAEITRANGHYNCLFTQDNNRLRVGGRPDDPMLYIRDDGNGAETLAALAEANRQGAFCFWNHPYAPGQPDKRVALQPFHRTLIERGYIQGIEVANGPHIHSGALDLARIHGLTVLGTSDTHASIASELASTGQTHRTTTLVLAESRTPLAVAKALRSRKTVALFRETLVGDTVHIATIATAALKIERLADMPDWEITLTPLRIENRSTIGFTLDIQTDADPFDSPRTIRVGPKSTLTIKYASSDTARLDHLKLGILNSQTLDRERAVVALAISKN